MNDSIYLAAERLCKKHMTRDPFELLDGLGVVTSFSHRFRQDGLKGFCTIINRTRYVVIKGKQEREANFFAADFLISDNDVLNAMQECGSNFFTVARALCIPESFFAFKLYSMVERGYSMRIPVELDNAFLTK